MTHFPPPAAGPLEKVVLQLPLQDHDVPLLQPVHLLPFVGDEGLGEPHPRHPQPSAQHEHGVITTLGQGARTPKNIHNTISAIHQLTGCLLSKNRSINPK